MMWIEIGLKSFAVLSVACALSLLAVRGSAALRHLIWTATFAALLALPLLSVSLPKLPLPVTRTALALLLSVNASAASPLPATSATAPATSDPRPAKSAWKPDWRVFLGAVWLIGSALSFTRMIAAWIAVCQLRRRASALASLEPGVEILEAEEGSMPMVAGLLRPAILLPSGMNLWSEERRTIVLQHELAHVRRGDVPTHWMARLAMGIYWWNPLAWFAWTQFLKERERAADDLVLAGGASASAYAGHLFEIARAMQAPAGAIAMVRKSQLEERVRAILDPHVSRWAPQWSAAWAIAILAIALVAPFAALHAQDARPATIPDDVENAVRSAVSQGKAEMLDNIARAADSQRKYQIEGKLLEAISKVYKDKDQMDLYGISLIRQGDLLRKTGSLADAVPYYQKALDVLAGKPASAPALTSLGVNALVEKHPEVALGFFEQAIAADRAQAGAPMTWIALLKQREDSKDEAEKWFQDALVLENPTSDQAATTMELYANFLSQNNRTDEAASLRERALSLRKANGAKPARAEGVYKMGEGVTPPKLATKVEPAYTDEARAAKYAGAVILSVEIAPDGSAHNIQVVKGLGLGLSERAVEAISQWQFTPGTKSGAPVTVMATIEVNFRLM